MGLADTTRTHSAPFSDAHLCEKWRQNWGPFSEHKYVPRKWAKRYKIRHLAILGVPNQVPKTGTHFWQKWGPPAEITAISVRMAFEAKVVVCCVFTECLKRVAVVKHTAMLTASCIEAPSSIVSKNTARKVTWKLRSLRP